jgi:hypothetical protein
MDYQSHMKATIIGITEISLKYFLKQFRRIEE